MDLTHIPESKWYKIKLNLVRNCMILEIEMESATDDKNPISKQEVIQQMPHGYFNCWIRKQNRSGRVTKRKDVLLNDWPVLADPYLPLFTSDLVSLIPHTRSHVVLSTASENFIYTTVYYMLCFYCFCILVALTWGLWSLLYLDYSPIQTLLAF